jgi:hypothetical protein
MSKRSHPAISALPSARPTNAPAQPGDEDTLPPALARAFAPLHKEAFGVAIGTAAGLAVFIATAARLLIDPEGTTSLSLLAQYFSGYTESWTGAVIGLAWGFAVGFVAGWFFAFARNLVIATWIFITRARAALNASSEFLDHI